MPISNFLSIAQVPSEVLAAVPAPAAVCVGAFSPALSVPGAPGHQEDTRKRDNERVSWGDCSQSCEPTTDGEASNGSCKDAQA